MSVEFVKCLKCNSDLINKNFFGINELYENYTCTKCVIEYKIKYIEDEVPKIVKIFNKEEE